MRFIYLVAARVLGGVRHRYLSMVSRIAIMGIAIGAATLIVVFSISSGFTGAFKDKILSLYPHVVVTSKAYNFRHHREVVQELESMDGVVSAVPATYDELMIVHRDRREEVILKGLPLGKPELTRLLTRVTLPTSGAAKPGSGNGWSQEVTASMHDGRVVVRGGVRGTTSRVLVGQRADGQINMWVWDGLWSNPTHTESRILFASTAELNVVCENQGMIQKAKTPKHGGFATEVEFEPGRHSCSVQDVKSLQRIAQWDLTIAGRSNRTIILLPDGTLRPRLDIHEPDLTDNINGRFRFYWPDKDRFSVQLPDGSSHEIEGSTSEWLAADLPLPSILVGSTVARKLRVEVGDTVELLSHSSGIMNSTMNGGFQSKLKSFRVAGILHSGFHDFDHRFVLADLKPVQRMFQQGDRIYWIEVRISNLDRTGAMVRRIKKSLDGKQLPDILDRFSAIYGRLQEMGSLPSGRLDSGSAEENKDIWAFLETNAQLGYMLRSVSMDIIPPSRYTILDWREMNQTLLSAIFLQQVILTIIFFIIILVAASNVVGNQIMLIHEKTTTISILRAMGSSQKQIKRIFHVQGLITALIGSLIGCCLGMGISLALRSYPLELNAEIYFIESLPVNPSVPAVLIVMITTLIGTWLATHVSAKKAATLDVLEGIHRVE